MDVYADVLFLINGGMDALCLSLTARMLHRRLSLWRLALAAALGGVYGVVALFLEVGTLPALLLDVLVCVLMCGVALGKVKLWLSSGVYVLSSMVMGGVMTALYHWLNRAGVAELLPAGEEGVSSVAFVLLAAVGGLFTLGWGRIFRRSERQRAARVSVSVAMGQGSVTLEGMVDSGNLLTDPFSGTPVIVVKKEAVAILLSRELQQLLASVPLRSEGISRLPEGGRVRLIPTDTATGGGMLLALRPDAVTVKVGDGLPVRVKALICPTDIDGAPAAALVPSGLLV